MNGVGSALVARLEASDAAGRRTSLGTAAPFNVTAAVDGGWRTERGCQCARPWSYYGSTHAEGQCANPDSDTVGTWCFLRAGSCPVGRA